ncbi:MAG: hypothetical protein WCR36_03465 [Bacteroidaceae bacterium]
MTEYYLRFTDTPQEDLRRNSSLFKTGSMKKAEVLSGLCGFSFGCEYDLDETSEYQIEQKTKMYGRNSGYDCYDYAVIYTGEYAERNRNDEGVVFRAESIYKIINL